MQNRENIHFTHLIWRSPQTPSFFYSPKTILFATQILQALRRRHRSLFILEAYREQCHLDLIVCTHDLRLIDQISQEITQRFQIILQNQPLPSAPLYFWTEGSCRKDFEESRLALQIEPDEIPKGYRLVVRPRGAHARWVYQNGNSRLWAQRRVQLLYRHSPKSRRVAA